MGAGAVGAGAMIGYALLCGMLLLRWHRKISAGSRGARV